MILSRIVRVCIEEKRPELFFAISPDLKGLFIAELSFQNAIAEVPGTIEALYAAIGEDVIVEQVGGQDEGRAWVVISVAAAEAALARHRQAREP